MEELGQRGSVRGEVFFRLSYPRERDDRYAEWRGCTVQQDILGGGPPQTGRARANPARLPE